MILKTLTTLLIALSFNAMADYKDDYKAGSNVANNGMHEVKKWIDDIDTFKTLPIDGLKFVKAGGRTFLTSDNGHYAIIGDFKLVDVWNNKVINTIKDIEDSNKIPMNIFTRQTELFSVIKYGNGVKNVYFFTDPKCSYCAKLAEQVPDLTDDYTFNFIVFSALAGSGSDSRKLACNKNQDSARALILNDYSNLENITRCDGVSMKLKSALTIGKVLGVKKIPFVIAPNGRPQKGYTSDLRKFLEDNND